MRLFRPAESKMNLTQVQRTAGHKNPSDYHGLFEKGQQFQEHRGREHIKSNSSRMSRADEIKRSPREPSRRILGIVSEYFKGDTCSRAVCYRDSRNHSNREEHCFEGISMDFKTKKPLLATEHYHKWIIEIKSSREATRHKIENNQMRYRVLMFIDHLLNEVS